MTISTNIHTITGNMINVVWNECGNNSINNEITLTGFEGGSTD